MTLSWMPFKIKSQCKHKIGILPFAISSSKIKLFIDKICRYFPAIYTHCYDTSGTRLFAAGGPLQCGLKVCNIMFVLFSFAVHWTGFSYFMDPRVFQGNYIGLWQWFLEEALRNPWTLPLWLMACWNLSGLWRQGTNFCHWSQRHYRNEMNSLVISGQESDGIVSQSMKVELWSWKWTRCLEELLSPRIHWGPKHLCLLVRWLCLYNMFNALLFDPDVSRKMRDWLR